MRPSDGSRRLYRSRLLPLLMGYFRQQGGDADRILDSYNIRASAREQPDLPVPLEVMREVIAEMATALDDDFFGLHAAQSMGRGGWGLVEFLAETSGTLRNAMSQFIRYQNLASNLACHRAEEWPAGVVFKQWVPGDPVGLGRHANEFVISVLVEHARLMIGTRDAPEQVWFIHPAPRRIEPLRTFLGTQAISFGATWNGLQVSRELCERPLVSADPALNAVLASQVHVAEKGSSNLIELALDKTLQALRSGPPSIERVAALLHMSGRTLQRRLMLEGSSFRELVDRARREASEAYLSNHSMALSEVAFLLGYNDLSSFVRAFKRWTGQTPGAFRVVQRAE